MSRVIATDLSIAIYLTIGAVIALLLTAPGRRQAREWRRQRDQARAEVRRLRIDLADALTALEDPPTFKLPAATVRTLYALDGGKGA